VYMGKGGREEEGIMLNSIIDKFTVNK
jgi:hypothetical protein